MEQAARHIGREPMDTVEDGVIEIDLIEVGYEILDKIKYIILSAVLGIIIAAVYVFFLAVPSYEAVAKLYVVNSNDSVINLSDFQLGNYLASDYSEMFKTWEVNEMVRNNLGLSYHYNQLEKMVKINNPANTRVLYITVASPDPKEAMLMANEYADVVSDYVQKIMDGKKPSMLSTAILPDRPVSPRKTTAMILGMLLGVFLSAGIVIVRYVLNDTVRSPDDVEKHLGLPVLAVVPIVEQSHENIKGRMNS